MHFEQSGSGRDLLLVHGLGGSARSWDTIAPQLARERRIIVPDLPGHGQTAAEHQGTTFDGVTDAIERFIDARGLDRIDAVGTSLGGRIVLELARRGRLGRVVALDPGGFWQGWERGFFKATLDASVGLLRLLGGALPALARNPAARSLLLAQLSARPWRLDGNFAAAELDAFRATPTVNALIRDLSEGPPQQGFTVGSGRVTIGWGRHDRLCLARQATRALAAFPQARLHWFEHSGHFPLWDEPEATVALILAATADEARFAPAPAG
jgi:pimeloyl-ACP methyl ester carboxylesterase